MTTCQYKVDGRSLLKVFNLRMCIFIAALILAVIFSAAQPKLLVDVFNKNPLKLLTRLWIIASLLATGILTYLGNRDILKNALEHKGPLSNKRDPLISKLSIGCNNLNLIIIAGVVLFIVLACWNGCSIFWINLCAGPVLVAAILAFDWKVMILWDRLQKETLSVLSTGNSTGQDGEIKARLTEDEGEYRKARHVFYKLDIPIYCGLLITFAVGMILLPKVIIAGTWAIDNPFVWGFSSGATALQLIIGNITFSIIGALPS